MQPDVFEWLESSPLAAYIRQSSLLFPIIEIVHIAGFVALTGSAFLFDLRLLGIGKQLRVTDLSKYLLPWSRRSLWLVIPSGVLLFVSQAKALSTNPVFGVKLILIVIAFLNAGIFHWRIFPSVQTWDGNTDTPIHAKAVAVISIVLWISVISCGRLIAYF